MRRAPTIKLDIPVRKELERLSRSRSVAVRLAERSELSCWPPGVWNRRSLKLARQKAGRWRDRFVEDGLGGIEKDASRSGRIPSTEAGPDREEDGRREASERHALEPVLDGQGNRRQRPR